MERGLKSERSLSDEGAIIGFGCSLCDWTTNTTELFKALPEFGAHNNEKHPDTPDARINYIYKQLRHPNVPVGSSKYTRPHLKSK